MLEFKLIHVIERGHWLYTVSPDAADMIQTLSYGPVITISNLLGVGWWHHGASVHNEDIFSFPYTEYSAHLTFAISGIYEDFGARSRYLRHG